jgi:hypothetical protein
MSLQGYLTSLDYVSQRSTTLHGCRYLCSPRLTGGLGKQADSLNLNKAGTIGERGVERLWYQPKVLESG